MYKSFLDVESYEIETSVSYVLSGLTSREKAVKPIRNIELVISVSAC